MIDTLESHILLQIDETYTLNISKGPYTAWVAFPTQEGIVKSLHTPNISSKYEINWTVKPGDHMKRPIIGRDYAGTVLLWNENYEKLRADFDYLNDYCFCNIAF